MKKIKAFFYVALKSIKSPGYYKEMLTTPLEFSIKYYIALAILASAITTLGTYFIESPKIKASVDNFISGAEKVFPSDLVIEIKDGEWEINKTEPLIIEFPGRNENEKDIPKNLIVFDKQGTIESLEKYDTTILVNEKNLLLRRQGQPSVYPLKDFPNNTIDKSDVDGLITSFRKIAVWVPFAVMVFIFSGLLVYHLFFRSVYLLLIGLALYVGAAVLRRKVNYKDSARIGLHAMTLPILIDAVLGLAGLTEAFPYWFLLLNLFLGFLVIFRFEKK